MAQVLPPASPRDSPPHFPSSPSLGYTPPSRPSIFTDAASFSRSLELDRRNRPPPSESLTSEPSSLFSSPRLDKSSVDSSPPSSISLDNKGEEGVEGGEGDYGDEGDDGEEPFFPTYNDNKFHSHADDSHHPPSPANEPPSNTPPSSVSESTPTNESIVSSPGVLNVADDTAVHEEPSRQVDYLSHDWREEDIWCSWRHIVSRRKIYGERSRLENASWRTWTKAKYRLKTVSPERLNWLKDCDVTWLYGPLQEASMRSHPSETSSKLSKSNSFINKKPILKKRSVSEVLLQKSLSTSSLVKQAALAVQAQRDWMQNGSQDQTPLSRTPSDFLGPMKRSPYDDTEPSPTNFPSYASTGLQSPENGRKHIRFDENVEQCIAVDFQDEVQRGEESSSAMKEPYDEPESSEDELVMMKPKSRKPASTGSSRRSSFGQDGNGIAMLPSTRLNDHEEELKIDGGHSVSRGSHHGGRLQHSSSQETLKPKDPSTNFLIEDDPDADMGWQPSNAFAREGSRFEDQSSDEGFSGGLRRTPSGMFMPFDDDEEEQSYSSPGVLGRVVDTVNTARDIMHVIMNVGWRS